jgi:hypothetical protein
MKFNNIFRKFLQVLVITGSGIFASKTASAQAPKPEDPKTINDRINLVREHIRSNPENGNLAPGNGPHAEGKTTLGQIWINIVPNWRDWNKLWNDWANWNNWQKWSDWGNFHRDHDHHDNGRGHDKDHDRGHKH